VTPPAHRHCPSLFRLAFLICFGLAFGFVEAAVTYYLRLLIANRFEDALAHYKVLLNLGFITFARPTHSLLLNNRITTVETVREAATIIMLASVACVSAPALRQRLGAFLVGFACWDISYYLCLRIVDHWPTSLMTKDIYFLIPVTWIGPVITPLVISTVMLLAGSWLYLTPGAKRASEETQAPLSS
jgi:hypothetical protein